MKITQKLNEEDLIFLNTFLSKGNIKEKFLIILIPILSFVASVLCFYKSYILFGIIFIVCGIFFGFGLILLKKNMIKKQSIQGALQLNDKEIIVTIDEKGILYAFSTENTDDIDPFIWGDLLKCTKINNYYIFEINYNTVLLVKPSNDVESDFINEICNKELILGIRYFIK